MVSRTPPAPRTPPGASGKRTLTVRDARQKGGPGFPCLNSQRRQLGTTCHVPSRDRTNPYDAATAGLPNISGW